MESSNDTILWFLANPMGFYSSDAHGEPPAGAIVITVAERDALLAGQEQGRSIVADPQTGRPTLREPAVIPETVTWKQAHLALLDAGLLDKAEALIDAMPPAERRRAQIEWGSPTYERSSAFLQQMWSALGQDAEALDALFLKAAAIA